MHRLSVYVLDRPEPVIPSGCVPLDGMSSGAIRVEEDLFQGGAVQREGLPEMQEMPKIQKRR